MFNIYFLIFPFVLFWVVHVLRRNLFWLYFWQKRGSRFNRFLNGLKENKGILFSKSSLFSVFIILISLFFPKTNNVFESLVFSLFMFLGGYSLYLIGVSIYFRDLKVYFVSPKFTKKITALFSLLSIFEILFFVIMFFQAGKTPNYFNFFIYFLIFEVLFPAFFTISVLIFKFFLFFLNKRSEKRAKKKINFNKDLIIIGIAGSYGKTLTKDFLYDLLSAKYNVLKTEGRGTGKEEILKTINKNLKKSHNIFIFEISAYKRGEVKKICQILNPKIGILTGVSEEHLALFGSLKNIINTKYEIINCLPEDGVGIFNIEDKECQKLFQRTGIKKYSYSLSEEKGDVFIKDLATLEDRAKFELITWKGKEEITLNFSNQFQIENLLGAIACALELDVEISQIKEIAPKIKISQGIMTKKTGVNNVQIIDDTLSQTPTGFFSAIDALKKYNGKKIIIASCLIELGKSAFAVHNNIGKKIGENCDLAVITDSSFLKEIKSGSIFSGMEKEKIVFLRNPKKIYRLLEPYLKEENIILLEGDIPNKIKEYILLNDKK